MNKRTFSILLGVLLLTGCNRGDRSSSFFPNLPINIPMPSQTPDTETANVEKVFLVQDGKFSSMHYLITWHGQQAIVDDPIHSTNYKVGDKIAFLVMKHDMSSSNEPNGPAVLGFHALPYVPAPRP